MFNLLVNSEADAWETDQYMSMEVARFKEYSNGPEAEAISADRIESLRALETVPAMLLYEEQMQNSPTTEVRYGHLRDIHIAGANLRFRFAEVGRFPRAVFSEFATRLGVRPLEHNRSHWAVKDGGIPRDMMARLVKTYDVALSFSGANRQYVDEVATLLRAHQVRVFYDSFEEAALWGRHLVEFLADVYQHRARYCVMFISRSYAEREWTNHERRAALDRAIRDRHDYLLPCRFDDTVLPGLSPSIGYVPLRDLEASALAERILTRIGMPGVA